MWSPGFLESFQGNNKVKTIYIAVFIAMSFPGSSAGKQSACSAGKPGSIPGLGRSPGEGNGYPLQYSCLENLWTEKPGGLQSMVSAESDTAEHSRAVTAISLHSLL